MRANLDWSQITALFGGTFDPPHLGHLIAAQGLLKSPGVRSVLILPSAAPPHKPSQASAEQRIEMARLTFPQFRIDARELERAKLGRPSYSYDTLRELQREIPVDRLAFVIGTDQLVGLPRWHRFPDILGLCHWIVLKRRGAEHQGVREALAPLLSSGLVKSIDDTRFWVPSNDRCLQLVETDAPELSSTAIRQEISRTGQVPENSVTLDVSAYLKLHRIYGTDNVSQ